LLEVLSGNLEILVSTPLMLEYESVLMRPEHLHWERNSEAEMRNLLAAISLRATPVRLAFRWRPQLPDPNDEMVLDTALNGRADAIVTFNERDFAEGAKRFQCKVLYPKEALSLFRRLRDEEK
jgi:predicted nucleic acid-binding protein